jgi:hypothetical protein
LATSGRRPEVVKDQVANVSLKDRGNGRSYILACLERHGFDDLSERVRKGEPP